MTRFVGTVSINSSVLHHSHSCMVEARFGSFSIFSTRSLSPFQVAQIRLVCVQSLQELYNPSLVYHLSMFTAKFKERLLKMRSDIDETVAVEVIKLLGQMLE